MTLPIPIPEGFAAHASLPERKLMVQYSVCRQTVSRWRSEIGTHVPARVAWTKAEDDYLRDHYRKDGANPVGYKLGRTANAVKARARKMGLETGRPRGWNMDRIGTSMNGERTKGLADIAAQHLRRLAAVYRCDPNGKANPNGTHWKYGSASLVLTEQELFERAERHGWAREQ